MPDYHRVTVIFPCGTKVRGVIKGDTLPPDLAMLPYKYGIKVRIGRRLKGSELREFYAQNRKLSIAKQELFPMRPLSPDFGRGSGAPI